MSEYVTDPEILKQLQGSAQPAEAEYVTDPTILKQLNGGAAIGEAAPAPTGSIERSAAQTAMSAGVNIGETGLGELANLGIKAAAPFTQSAVGPTAAIYKAHPILAPLVDTAGLATVGVPPIAATQSALGIYDKYKGAVQAGNELSKGLSQSEIVKSPTTGAQYPATVPDYYKMQNALRSTAPEIGAKLSDLYNNKGGSNAVRAWLQSEEAAPYMNNPAFREAAESYIGKVPGAMSQIGKVVGPIARGVAKAAGPVGIGMNLYDAGQMARDTQLGERLKQGQGQFAERAFRNGPVQKYQGPQLQPGEAQNVLQSGSPRDIKYFGGRDNLTEMIRKKAAEKVLGPTAPGSF